jgi:hypothetical protein
VVGAGTGGADGDGDRRDDEDERGGEDGTADAVDEGLLGGRHELAPGLAELTDGGGLGEGDGALGSLGNLRRRRPTPSSSRPWHRSSTTT